LKILLVGHACSPRRGSELAFTWNWAWHLSQKYEVWVLTHPQEKKYIEDFLAEDPNPNMHFCWVTVPRWLDTWDPASGGRTIRLHYHLWQKAALQKAQSLHEELCFQLVHHVSWGTVSEPPLLWQLPIPFVWGPVGGGQVSPKTFRGYLGTAAWTERLRDARMRLIPFRPVLKKAARRSAMIFATNHKTAEIIERAGAARVELFLDTGIREDFLPAEVPQRPPGSQLRLLWVGSLIPRKCLPLAIEGLARVRDLPVRLAVAGKGEMRRQWEGLAEKAGVGDRVEFLGEVPYNQMPALYRAADAFIFTSIRDAFGSQVLEAMAAGLPIIALDHQGVGAFVPGAAGVKVPVTVPCETIDGLARAIRTVAGSANLRNRMGQAGWEFAWTQTWARRTQLMCRYYEEAMDRYCKMPQGGGQGV
jgi:glycosyltransferase involved in cell wall biosynthesis